MRVRRLTSGDESLWCQAVAEVVAEENREGPLAPEREIALALGDLRCYLLVAEVDANPVGVLSAYRFPDVMTGGELVYLYDIETRIDYRRKGVGATLICSLIECCQKDRVRRIWAGTDVTNMAARHTFEATGAELEGDSYVEYEWKLQG
jgi:ribosomal protein S18 acetylase RimI-like enzyme